jgi:hypothetical protein
MSEKELPVKLLTKQEFALQVETLVKKQGMGYLEAIVEYCDAIGVEPDEVSKLIVGSLKEKLEAEAMRNNLLPRSSGMLF